MRVLEFGEVPPPFGGVTVHLRRLLNCLVDDGFDLTLVTRRAPENLDGGIVYVRWPTLPRYLNHFEFFRGLGEPFGTGILHLHTNPVFCAPLVWLHIRRGGVALITVHDQMVGCCPRKDVKRESAALDEYMVNAFTLDVPTRTDPTIGTNFGEMKKA